MLCFADLFDISFTRQTPGQQLQINLVVQGQELCVSQQIIIQLTISRHTVKCNTEEEEIQISKAIFHSGFFS